MFNIAVAQSGGPTAAINSSLTGVFNGAEQNPEVDEIYGAENGIEGILGDRLLNLRNILTDEERESVSPQDIAKCLESDIMKVALKAEKKGKCHREQSFMMYKKASEVSDDFTSDDRVLVQGVIDLFIDDEKKIIVDFKTSSLKDEKTLEKYKKQLYLYKSAVESAINAKVDEIALYSFATGKTVIL